MPIVDVLDQPERAQELVGQGGLVTRHFLQMALDLVDTTLLEVKVPAGFDVAPMSVERLRAYGEVVSNAYSGDHPDHEADDDDPVTAARAIEGYLTSTSSGWPWHRAASAHILDPNGAVAGFVVVTDGLATGEDAGGPWITEIAVRSDLAGKRLGTALLTHSARMLAEEGKTELGLAVTVGNPAITVYQRFGFGVRHEIWRIQMPAS